MNDAFQQAPVLRLACGLPGVSVQACNSLQWARASQAAYRALSEQETGRVARLKTPQAQETLAASLASARMMLGRSLGVPPSDVDVQRDAQGAPFLAGQLDRHLSISRSEGWTAIALGDGHRVGLDIERSRPIDWRAMLAMVCSDAERGAMLALAARAEAAFFELWTIKEAVLKAVGTGLRGGARGVPVEVATLGRPEGADRHIAFGHAVFGVRTQWHDGLVVSLAVAASS